MKKFPSNVVNRYIRTGGSNCPYCGSPDISSHGTAYEVDKIYDRIKCDMCFKEWYEIYKLTDIEVIGEK